MREAVEEGVGEVLQAQRVGGHFQLVLQGVRIAGGEDRLEPLLFLGQRVEVGAFLGVGRVDLVQPCLRLQHFADAFLDRLAHGHVRIELRLLRQVADLDAGLRPRLAREVGVDAGHDLEHGRLAGAVEAEQADLGAREERQRDVLDDLALWRDRLGHAVHGVDVLHGGSAGGRRQTWLGRAALEVLESRNYSGRPACAGRPRAPNG